MQTKKLLGWAVLIGLGGFWLADHWPKSDQSLDTRESPSLPPALIRGNSAVQPHLVDEEVLAAKRQALEDTEFLSQQRDVLKRNPPIRGEFSGKWGIVSGALNVPELHLRVDNVQEFTIFTLPRDEAKASMMFLVSGEIIPCGADKIAVQFRNGDIFALHNKTHYCPQGYALYTSDEEQARRIAKALNANGAPPALVSYGTAAFYLDGAVEPEDMSLLLHAMNTCAPDEHCGAAK